MAGRTNRGSLLQELSRLNRWWAEPEWEKTDPQLTAAAAAPYGLRPSVLDDATPPNLYTLRGPRRVGKSTLLKQTISRLLHHGVDPRRICYFAADSVETYRDLINVFQAARQLFPDLGATPRYFLLDEATTVREWQRGIKWLRDNTPIAEDCVIVTGSSASDVAAGTLHLAGRRGPDVGLDRLLLPMSFPEFVRCAGYPLPVPEPLPLAAFYTEDGRQACQRALAHLGILVDAFEAYLLVGGFPQAVSSFRCTAAVSSGFARDLWDVVRSDLQVQGVSRPEHCLNLMEQVASSIAMPLSMQTVADRLAIDRRTASAWLEALANSYLLLILFKENDGVADVNSLRKIYPIDPLVARLPSLLSANVREPTTPQLAEAALALAIFRAAEGQAVDGFRRPGHLFYFKSQNNAEVDYLVLPGPRAAESKYIDTPDRRELRAMQANFREGLLLTRSGVDIQPGGTVLPASVFAWLLDQEAKPALGA